MQNENVYMEFQPSLWVAENGPPHAPTPYSGGPFRVPEISFEKHLNS